LGINKHLALLFPGALPFRHAAADDGELIDEFVTTKIPKIQAHGAMIDGTHKALGDEWTLQCAPFFLVVRNLRQIRLVASLAESCGKARGFLGQASQRDLMV
jgi:hypothetical protein